jgi:sugar phosphate isomerase/epimerase
MIVAVLYAETAAAGDAPKPAATHPFFAFDNGVGLGRVPLDDQAAILKDLGYDGISYTGAQRISEMLKALDARGLKLFSIYVELCLTPEQGKPAYDPVLKDAIEQLKGRGTQIWLPISGGKPSSLDLDDRAVAIVREIAELADKSGLQVAIYPHLANYIERVEDAQRLVKKVDRKNVGLAFNLCHFLKTDSEKNLEQRLKEVNLHLFAVSINGADVGDTNQMGWDRLIQTLGRGSFDVARVLKSLDQLGYAGPIGLQCYGISGDIRENLTHSMKAWRSLTSREAEAGGSKK